MRDEARQAAYRVVLTIFQDGVALCAGKRRTLQDTIPHVALVGDVEFVFAEIAQRAGKRVKAFVAILGFGCAVVHVVAKFHVSIERTCGLAPTACNMAAEFGGEHIADEQRVRVKAVGWERAKLILPQPNDAARSHLISNEAERRYRVAVSASVGLTGSGIVLGSTHQISGNGNSRQSR